MTKLTKELLDKVRHIEGFPIGEDEDIIALSDPPHYTACPNPFIEDFIKEHGKPYDEETDDYHREPFAADVSEGKNDPIYNAYSYHTKVPHKAIMRYILHYTEPGDIVFDGFCGSGMTGVAAQMCDNPDPEFKLKIEKEMPYVKWGARKAILGDLSPAAAFIAANYNFPVNVEQFEGEAKRILEECEIEYGWMYETQHVDEKGNKIVGLDGKPIVGRINYVIWSDILICPSCQKEIIYWDVAVSDEVRQLLSRFRCNHCSTWLTKNDCERVMETVYDKDLNSSCSYVKQTPVLINYSVGNKRFEKKADSFDLQLLDLIKDQETSSWYPDNMLPKGEKTQDPIRIGVTHVHHFYTRRSLLILSRLWEKAWCQRNLVFMGLMFSILVKTASKLHNVGFKNGRINLAGQVPNTLYIPSILAERDLFRLIAKKLAHIAQAQSLKHNFKSNNVIISVQDCANQQLPDSSIDYIFTDPPFGANLMYSELNFLWEAWLKILTNNNAEAIVNKVHKKKLLDYENLMLGCFSECYRILRPGRWITVEFHNSSNSVWNSIQDALLRAGFIVGDVRVLNKQQGSYNQMTALGAVKQDLIISAYKPRESFRRRFLESAGAPDAAWEFVRQHLEKLPAVVETNGKLGVIAERQAYLLFDRMVAYHVVNGITVPMDAGDFYKGLKSKFAERDGMYFLPNQVSEYDAKRLSLDFNAQLSFFVTDEKSARQWLYQELLTPQTYQEIQPKFIRELHQFKHEKLPELRDLLEESFLQDVQGRWYIPDPNKQSDLDKLREKALLRAFEEYKAGKGMLKVFRTEAVRAGFKACWQNRDYATIVQVANRIPEKVLQEDQTMLMFYNNALTRVEK